VHKSANVGVQRDYQLNLNAIAKDKAISLSDMGKKDEAVSELKKSADQLRYLGQKYDDEKLLNEAEAMEQQAEQIDNGAAGRTDRGEGHDPEVQEKPSDRFIPDETPAIKQVKR